MEVHAHRTGKLAFKAAKNKPTEADEPGHTPQKKLDKVQAVC
jgi:hypothetical protein